ncbi:MAG: phosphoribosyltransferase [Saprospirales bacterium]|nr:MAG: phosphoribosyltransferase [Saprospirales bacterium]
MKVLSNEQIRQKIVRLTYQILEEQPESEPLYILGINNNGRRFAELLEKELIKTGLIEVISGQISLKPASPNNHPIELNIPKSEIAGKTVLIIDDVANTGRTLFYAFSCLMEALPKKVSVGVLVDRKHKSFPVKVDYVGLSLATTLMENIDVYLDKPGEMSVFLT